MPTRDPIADDIARVARSTRRWWQPPPVTYTGAHPTDDTSLIRWMWFFIRPYRAAFWSATGLRIMMHGLWSSAPFWLARIVEGANHGAYTHAVYALLALVGLHTTAGLIGLTRSYLEGPLRDRLKREFTLYAVRHTMSLSLAWHETMGTGNKMQRVFTARNAMSQLLMSFWAQLIPIIAVLASTSISLIALGAPFYIVLFLIYAASYFAISYRMALPIGRINDALEHFFEKIIGRVYEFTAATQTIKSLNLLPTIVRRAWAAEQNQMRREYTMFRAIYDRWFTIDFFSYLAVYGGITGYALWQLAHGQLSVGVFIAIFWQGAWIWDALERFADAQEDYFQHRASFLRITKTLRVAPPMLDIAPLVALPKNWRAIHFDDVAYAYHRTPVLSRMSLTIPRGQTVALVGRSGAGKSTFVKLLLKHVLPTHGTIRFDDIDTRHIAHSELLATTAVVLQETELFDTSIRDNVLLRAKHSQKLNEYLRIAHALDFVEELPNGARTIIGERGVRLSGGQKQRIGIARALAQEADILIFDEATSSLDSESEQAIQSAMRDIFADRTAFIIAHRLSTVRYADRILVFDRGRIVEDGTFEQLVKKPRGHFARLWRLQRLD